MQSYVGMSYHTGCKGVVFPQCECVGVSSGHYSDRKSCYSAVQWRQTWDSSPEWRSWCPFMWLGWEDDWSIVGQVNGLSPEWISRCSFRLPAVLKYLSHWVQPGILLQSGWAGVASVGNQCWMPWHKGCRETASLLSEIVCVFSGDCEQETACHMSCTCAPWWSVVCWKLNDRTWLIFFFKVHFHWILGRQW